MVVHTFVGIHSWSFTCPFGSVHGRSHILWDPFMVVNINMSVCIRSAFTRSLGVCLGPFMIIHTFVWVRSWWFTHPFGSVHGSSHVKLGPFMVVHTSVWIRSWWFARPFGSVHGGSHIRLGPPWSFTRPFGSVHGRSHVRLDPIVVVHMSVWIRSWPKSVKHDQSSQITEA